MGFKAALGHSRKDNDIIGVRVMAAGRSFPERGCGGVASIGSAPLTWRRKPLVPMTAQQPDLDSKRTRGKDLFKHREAPTAYLEDEGEILAKEVVAV